MISVPDLISSYTVINEGLFDYYCQEFGVAPTDTYPQELLNHARDVRCPYLVIHNENDHPIVIALTPMTYDLDMALLHNARSTNMWASRIITNALSCNISLTNEHIANLSIFLGLLVSIHNKYRDVKSIPSVEQHAVNASISVLRTEHPHLIYVAARVVPNLRVDEWPCMEIFLYYDDAANRPEFLN